MFLEVRGRGLMICGGGGIEEENEDEDDNKEFNDVPDIGPNGLPIWDGHVNDLQVIEHELNVVPGMR